MPQHLGAEERPAAHLLDQRREFGVVRLTGDRSHCLGFGGFPFDVRCDARNERVETRESPGERAFRESDAAFAVGRELVDALQDSGGGVRGEALA